MEANEIVAPVIFAERLESGLYSIKGDIKGTCFSLGGSFCITAGHVATNISCCPAGCIAVIGFRSGGRWITAEITEHESLKSDIGVLKYTFRNKQTEYQPAAFSWQSQRLPLLASIKTIGYPFGLSLDDRRANFTLRAFQGYIVSTRTNYKPVGYKGAPFGAYELSFNASEGLSGAPLFFGDDPTVISGVIIGNNESRMLVHQSTSVEQINESAQTRIIEHYNYFHLGVAVMSSEIIELESQLLNGRVGDYLAKNNLL